MELYILVHSENKQNQKSLFSKWTQFKIIR